MNLTLQNGHRLRDYWPEVGNLFDHIENARQRAMTGWSAPISVWEADDKFHLEMDVPGASQESLDVTVEKGVLSISVERNAPEGEFKFVHNERSFGKLTRSLRLPETLDPETIEAQLTGGVLHLSIAKLPVAQAKKIEVKIT